MVISANLCNTFRLLYKVENILDILRHFFRLLYRTYLSYIIQEKSYSYIIYWTKRNLN